MLPIPVCLLDLYVCAADMSKVDPEDPGYNLRPEHIESTYLLHCTTQVRGAVALSHLTKGA